MFPPSERDGRAASLSFGEVITEGLGNEGRSPTARLGKAAPLSFRDVEIKCLEMSDGAPEPRLLTEQLNPPVPCSPAAPPVSPGARGRPQLWVWDTNKDLREGSSRAVVESWDGDFPH